MHQFLGRRKVIIFHLLALFFLSSINSQIFVEKKKSFYNLKSIEVIGLDNTMGSIEKNKLADFIILRKKDLEIEQTFISGKSVYKNE